MDVLLLGPVVVEGDRAVTIRQRRQRALLALLALRAGETVAVDRLVEDLWGAEAPRTALASLHNAVSQLRKLLGPEIVVTRDPGYAVDGDVTVDTARFEHLLTEAQAARSMRDEETAAAILREALGLGSRRLRAGRAPTPRGGLTPASASGRWRGGTPRRGGSAR